MTIVEDPTPAGAFSYVLPTLPKRVVFIELFCSFNDQSYSYFDAALGSLSSIAVNGAPPPLLSLPVDRASYVTSDTPFAWSTEQTQYSVVEFSYTTWSIIHYGTAHTTTFPDLGRFGIPFPTDERVTWRVYTSARSPGLKGTTNDALNYSLLAPDETATWAASSTRTFDTAPPPSDE
jgi:hypothetical protein